MTLTNASGATYLNAKLQLAAGNVNRVREEMAGVLLENRVLKSAAMAAPKMAQESLFEYHLYTLDRPTTIAEKQTKQVALLSATGVPARKEFVLRGADYYYQSSHGEIGQKLKVGVFVEFDNKGGNLGVALPKGDRKSVV